MLCLESIFRSCERDDCKPCRGILIEELHGAVLLTQHLDDAGIDLSEKQNHLSKTLELLVCIVAAHSTINATHVIREIHTIEVWGFVVVLIFRFGMNKIRVKGVIIGLVDFGVVFTHVHH